MAYTDEGRGMIGKADSILAVQFGSWYICYTATDASGYQGPSLFYRSGKETTPASCRDISLISAW